MYYKLHNNFWTTFLLLSFLVLIPHSPLWAQPATVDYTKYHWLIKLFTDEALRYSIYDRTISTTTRSTRIHSLATGLTAQEEQKVASFVSSTTDERHYGALGMLNAFLCKRRPCPPISAQPQDLYWVVRAMREPSYRYRLFDSDPQVRDQAISEIGTLTAVEKAGWTIFASYTDNATIIGQLGAKLCAVWGPCP